MTAATIATNVGWLIAGYVLGTLAHEATHYGLAWAFGMYPSIGLSWSRRVYVEWDAYAHPTVRDWLITSGPFIVGVIGLVGWWLYPFEVTIWHIAAWIAYTLLGLPNDMRFRVVDEDMPV